MGGGKEGGREEREREGGRVRLNSLGSGWFRFRGWFAFALDGWMDGLLEALVWFVWSGLVWSGWSGLAVFSSGGVTTRSVLSGRSFVSCCMLYTVYSTRFCLVFARFLVLT